MADENLYSMYNAEEEDDRGPSPTYQIMNGLRLSGAHIQKLQIGDQTVEIPGVRYMQMLEQEVRDAKKKIRNQALAFQRLEKKLASLEKTISSSKFFPTYE